MSWDWTLQGQCNLKLMSQGSKRQVGHQVAYMRGDVYLATYYLLYVCRYLEACLANPPPPVINLGNWKGPRTNGKGARDAQKVGLLDLFRR